MAEKKRALGKGLSALLNNQDTDITKNKSIVDNNQVIGLMSEIKIEQIEINPFQPRIDFDQDTLQELAISIKELGIIQPLTVRKLGQDKFQLISGERRFRASLVENIQRDQLNPVEIALSYQRLIDECKLTQEKMSERVGKKRSTITNYLRLLKLPPEILSALRDDKISMGHARALVNVKNHDTQINIFRDAVKNSFTVREIEQIVKDFGDSSYTKISINRGKILPSFEHQKLANEISKKLDKDVKLKVYKSGRGKIEIPFNSNDDLHYIISKLVP